MKALEDVLPTAERDRIRQRCLARPGWYSPWLHLGITSLSGIAFFALGVALVHDVKAWQLGFAGLIFVVSNATEWRLHRDVLHKRNRGPAAVLYDRHTPEHHVIYTTDDMEIRERSEFRLVLIPWFGILGVALLTLPATLALWVAGQPNLAGLFMATTMLYVVSYEWLHLSYHLPARSFIGRMRVIGWLRRTHAVHHDPRLMQRWNFNVTLPLWDVVRRTYVTDRDAALAARQQRKA